MQMDSHGESGTVRKAEAGVENEIDSSTVRTYAAPTPRKVEDSASWWPALRAGGMAALAAHDLKHNAQQMVLAYAVHIFRSDRRRQHERLQSNRRKRRALKMK